MNVVVMGCQGVGMFLDIHELELRKIFFDQTLPVGRIDFGRDIRQTEPLLVTGSAELVAAEIHLEGALNTCMETSCDRCLEPMRDKVDVQFDLFYRPAAEIAKNEEIEIRDDDLDIGFYEGNGLKLEDALKEQVLLALPMKHICRADCAGLCPQCGQNRNLADCGCRSENADVRWAPLSNLKK
jgi:uncharacterized protein